MLDVMALAERQAVRIVAHHHAARVARQAPGRFGRDVRAVLEDGLAGRVRIGQHRHVDVDDDLVALAGDAGIDPVMERRFGDEGQRVIGSVTEFAGCARRYSASRAAVSACTSTAPTSGASRPRTTTIPLENLRSHRDQRFSISRQQWGDCSVRVAR
jgi:hypothetical protein